MSFTTGFCLAFALIYTVLVFVEKDSVRRTVYSVGTVVLCALANLSDQVRHLVK